LSAGNALTRTQCKSEGARHSLKKVRLFEALPPLFRHLYMSLLSSPVTIIALCQFGMDNVHVSVQRNIDDLYSVSVIVLDLHLLTCC